MKHNKDRHFSVRNSSCTFTHIVSNNFINVTINIWSFFILKFQTFVKILMKNVQIRKNLECRNEHHASLTSLSLASHSFLATPSSLAKGRRAAGLQSTK